LVGAAGAELGPDQACHWPERRAEALLQPVLSNGLTATRLADRHALAVDRVAADRRLDRAALGRRRAPHHRLVDAGEIVCGKHLRQRLVRTIVLGNYHYARRVLVEAMHDAWPADATDTREARSAMCDQRIDQGVVGIAGRGMDNQTGR